MNLLFICSRNQWRSLTAEHIFKNQPRLSVRSAGTSPSARVKISAKLIEWADILYVMEPKHRELLEQKFAPQLIDKEIISLNIPDEFKYMDAELIELLKDKVLL